MAKNKNFWGLAPRPPTSRSPALRRAEKQTLLFLINNSYVVRFCSKRIKTLNKATAPLWRAQLQARHARPGGMAKPMVPFCLIMGRLRNPFRALTCGRQRLGPFILVEKLV